MKIRRNWSIILTPESSFHEVAQPLSSQSGINIFIINCEHNCTTEHRHSSLRRVDAVIMQLYRGGAISGVHDFTVQVIHAFEIFIYF